MAGFGWFFFGFIGGSIGASLGGIAGLGVCIVGVVSLLRGSDESSVGHPWNSEQDRSRDFNSDSNNYAPVFIDHSSHDSGDSGSSSNSWDSSDCGSSDSGCSCDSGSCDSGSCDSGGGSDSSSD